MVAALNLIVSVGLSSNTNISSNKKLRFITLSDSLLFFFSNFFKLFFELFSKSEETNDVLFEKSITIGVIKKKGYYCQAS